jgi:hypothetical protein
MMHSPAELYSLVPSLIDEKIRMCIVLCASAQFVASIFPKSGLFSTADSPLVSQYEAPLQVLCIDVGENEENIGRKREIGGRVNARSNMMEVPP